MDDILVVSTWNNARWGITGALGFSDGAYVQLLEGPSDALDTLLSRLHSDPRHTELQVLARGEAQSRLLPDWSMARVDLAKVAPRIRALLETSDGLGLISLLANVAHTGLTARATSR